MNEEKIEGVVNVVIELLDKEIDQDKMNLEEAVDTIAQLLFLLSDKFDAMMDDLARRS